MLSTTRCWPGLLVLALVTACSEPSGEGSGGSSRPASEDLDGLIAKVVEAQGGEEALAQVTSIFRQRTGRVFSLEERGRRVVVLLDPAGGVRYAEGFDGSQAWQIVAYQEKQEHSEAARAALWRATQFPSALVPLSRMKELGHSLELAGSEHIEGTEYHRLILKLSDGFERDYFIHAGSYRIERARDVQGLDASADEKQPIEIVWSDFRRVDGVWIPFQSGQRNYETGEVLPQDTMRLVRLNVSVADDVFRPDGSLETLLEKIREIQDEVRNDVANQE